MFITSETAERLGYVAGPGPVVLVTERMPTQEQEESARQLPVPWTGRGDGVARRRLH